MHGICVCVGNVSSDAEKANCNIDQHNDYSWVDELGSELGKRNLTYLTPEEDFSENVSNQAQLDLDYFVVKSEGRSRRHTGSLLTHFICLA